MSGYPGWEKFNPKLRTAETAVKKRGKYNAEPTEIDGHRFASQREAKRYTELLLEQRAGGIHELQLQEQFALHVTDKSGVKVCVGRYIADFSYVRDGQALVEDAKGMRTELYKWKKRHVEAEYGIQVIEV